MNGLEVLLTLACAVGFALMARHIHLLDQRDRQRMQARLDEQSMREWKAITRDLSPTGPSVMPRLPGSPRR